MTPIERVRLRSEALSTLGVKGQASLDDIRAAFKEQARIQHPDAATGSKAAFQKIREAYRFLTESTPQREVANVNPKRPVRTTRKSLPVLRHRFSGDIVAACNAGLNAAFEAQTRHVATEVRRKGRHVVFVVPTAAGPADNLVIIPCADITQPARFAPSSVLISAEDVLDGYARLSPEDCAELFPGARSVRIRFAT